VSVHIGEWVNHHLVPKCRAIEPSSTMTGQTDESIKALADCVECVQEWMQDRCTICNGTGVIDSGCHEEGCCGTSPCHACDEEAAEDFIARRKPTPPERQAVSPDDVCECGHIVPPRPPKEIPDDQA
jgi:hypothetical protein